MRVAVPAYSDAWFQGDRYGEVVRIRNAKRKIEAGARAALLTKIRWADSYQIAHVKLDKSGKTKAFLLVDCTVIEGELT